MIPNLKINDKFLSEVEENDVEWWEMMSKPILVFEYDNIPIYNHHAETYVGKDWLFNEYKKAKIDLYGYCPSEDSLRKIVLSLKEHETKYMVTAFVVEKYVADHDDGYGCYYNEEGENTDMSYPDYVDDYGHPATQYKNCVIRFHVYKLIELFGN